MSAVADTYTPRLKEQYENEIRPRLKEELGLRSIMQAPRIEKASPMPVSNVMVICPTCKKPTRVGTHLRTVKDKTIRVRVCRNADCGQEIDK